SVPVASAINGQFIFCEDTLYFPYSLISLPGSTITWFLNGDTISSGVDNDTIFLVWDSAGIFSLQTYEITVNGCVDSLYDTVTVYKTPNTSAISGDTSICFYPSDSQLYFVNGLPGSTYQWIITGGSVISTPPGDDSVIVIWDSVGAWNITVIETSVDSCIGAPVILNGNTWQVPVASSINGQFIFCEDSLYFPYTLISLPGSTITWFLNGDTISSGVDNDTIFFVWDSAGIFALQTYEITVNGCVDSLYDTVTVYKTPNTSAISGDTSICFYPSDSQLYFVSGLPGSTYQWIVTGGSVVSAPPDDDSVIVVWDSVGAWNITVIETSVDSCVGAPVTLNGNTWQVPVAPAINGQFIFCEDTPYFPYTLISLSGSTITWFLNGDTISSGVDNDTIFLVWDSAGVFLLQSLEITINNCTDTLSATVNVFNTPDASTISGDTSICFYQGASYLYYLNGLPWSTYQWNVTGGSIVSLPQDADSVWIIWDTIGSWNITLIETSVDACIGDTLFLSGNTWSVPVASAINGQFIFCEDTLYFPYSLISLPGSTITWFLNGDTISSGVDNDTISFVWDSAGIFIISVTEITVNSCSDSLSDTVVVTDVPEKLPIYGDTVICFIPGDSFLYYINGFQGSTYQWIVTNGVIVSAPLNNDSVIITWDTLGSGTILVIETSASNCTGDTNLLNVSINEIPSADSIGDDFELCQFSKSETYSLNGLPGSYYLWNIPGGFNIVDDSSSQVTVDWDSSGQFIITVLEVSSAGCISDTIDSLVIVHPAPQTSPINGALAVCPPYNFNEMYYVTGFDSSLFTWSVTGGVIVSGQGNDTVYVNWDTTGAGIISVIETTKDSCTSGQVTALNIILDSPVLPLNVVTDKFDNDRVIDLNWEMINNGGFSDSLSVFRRIHFPVAGWDSVTRVLSADGLFTDINVETHYYSYEYKLQSKNACDRNISSLVHNSILLGASNNESEKTISLVWNHYYGWQSGVDRYELWRKLDNEADYSYYRNMNLDTAAVLEDGKAGFLHCFRIVAYQGGGSWLSWSNDTCVTFQHQIVIPTAISPDGNGFNDVWKIDDIDMYPNCDIEIYNRWGEKIEVIRGNMTIIRNVK
ncbi:MAG: gliding motility-associated C-terminal domain-containing protein, partial [Bacteroidetes bacterium]|nr:gliding motility-associated C-terminal domain-containing protein [Bacteroidota bacterium]